MFNNFRTNLGKGDKCCSQPAIIDHISQKRWAIRIERFEKSPMRVSFPVF
jgi:hypothetical protein